MAEFFRPPNHCFCECCGVEPIAGNLPQQIGNSVTLTPPTKLAADVIRFRGDHYCAKVMTLDLAAEVDFGPGGGEIPPAIAILADVEWGIGAGAIFRATVDVQRGTQLCFPANQLAVRMYIDQTVQNLEFMQFAKVVCQAGALWGTRPSRGIVTRTFQEMTLAADAVAQIEVPAWAYAFKVWGGSDPNGNPFQVSGLSFAPGGLAYFQLTNFNTGGPFGGVNGAPPWQLFSEADGLKIPNGCRFITIHNTDDVERNFFMQFFLNL